MIRCTVRTLVWTLSLAGFLYCSGRESSEGGVGTASSATRAAMPDTSSTEAAEARRVFNARCAVCHGEDGKGGGPLADELITAAPDFQDATWQSSVTDPEIEKVIQDGGAALGKSAAMPSDPDLASQPEIVAALREYVRSFGR
jgi:mono/diheme cytochrome c family protein